MLFRNTDTFIKNAKLIHGEKYDYSKVNYIKAILKVEIICPTHGSFYQQPNNHLTGYGCKKCALEYSAKKRINSIEYFVEKSNKLHNNKYDYSMVVKGHNDVHVSIICPIHGAFKQAPKNHLLGKGCVKCKNEESAKRFTSNTNDFVKKAELIHGNQYDYSNVNYQSGKMKVSIVCKIHGVFFQNPKQHLRGSGCQICAEIIQNLGYKQIGHTDANKIKCSFYIAKLYDENECFYKIGISKNIKGRFIEMRARYSVDVLMERKSTLDKCVELEQYLLKKMSLNKYMPKKHFEGKTECFNFNPIQFVKCYSKKWK